MVSVRSRGARKPFTPEREQDCSMQQVGQEEAEDFVERVDEVTRLIEGLKDGSLPPEYIDKRESEIVEREQKKEESRRKEEQELEENRFDKLPKERQQELLKKVEDLQRNKERKDKLRAAFEAHVEDRKRTGGKVSGTDYHAWDLWTPSDEEDEIYNNLTPNSAEFKALEKDIDERHAKLLKSRQYAERQRELGNKMFKAKQYAKALQIYEEGISMIGRQVKLCEKVGAEYPVFHFGYVERERE